MGIFSKLLGAVSAQEMHGAKFDFSCPHWKASGKTTFPPLLRALPQLLPADCTLYFEGGFPHGALLEFLKTKGVSERTHIAFGTIWPRPRVDHVPATQDNCEVLAELMDNAAEAELAIHFHVYRDQVVLLEWHDAFDNPMYLSSELSEAAVQKFCQALGFLCERGMGAV